ncbi:DUF3987 domain-containing protein [Undibacterium arcticum]
MDEAGRMPCPPDYIAAALVVALGSLIGARCAVKPKRRDDSWLVTANLWGGVVGEPSAKKNPSHQYCDEKNMDRLEAVEAEKLIDKQANFAAELAAFKAHEKCHFFWRNEKKAASGKADPKQRSDQMEAAKYDLATLQQPEEPYPRRFKSNDGTVEKNWVTCS